ncbi:tetratricopeptide repeat protein [Rufibacter glacialis]|uniref:Tetratricopeptide repeat protein n=1 Tax=Rufibacter glacialis TaxID=1259555 RepID=A0A5M8QHS8_9BACT|nr:tetratricopeptide repeat protein [Rufibacter glacialis]KAA6434788.1 tetratricopeptide repeat protein [Rufibacter glacialis]GGK72437.1 hypothetical protein GCM10011405_20840 [Rufibacter glacialis]
MATVKTKPTGETTLVILLGASEYPKAINFNNGINAFMHASNSVRDYFMSHFNVPKENFLDFFDTPLSASDIHVEMARFLESGIDRLRASGSKAKDLIFYYIGHGDFVERGQEYYLAIKGTEGSNPGPTSIGIRSLAFTLKEFASHIRKTVILDCCFSGSAAKDFMGLAEKAATIQTLEVFKEVGTGEDVLEVVPEKGTALFCSSNHTKPALIAPDGSTTMFTDGLISALVSGKRCYPDYMSLRTLAELTEQYLVDKYGGAAPKPEVHSPDQRQGDIAKIPFFPNKASYGKKTLDERSPIIRIHSGEVPIPVNKFFGRHEEKALIKEFFRPYGSKIVTLTGCNGIGKTRLAIEIAKELADVDVRFIPLASVLNPKQVPTEIAPTVEFPEVKSPRHLINFLKKKSFLLVLDNFENLLDANDFIQELQANCENLKLLITSQCKLGIEQENVIKLFPLNFPKPADLTLPPEDLIANFCSISLFVERAQEFNSSFELTEANSREVAEICMRTKGLPLAIETISSHIDKVEPKVVLKRIKSSGFLNNSNTYLNIIELYKTIQETNSWNYSFLKDEERQVFRFLSVFEGGFTPIMAKCFFKKIKQSNFNSTNKSKINDLSDEDIDNAIESLVGKRLLKKGTQIQFDGQFRYSMLETIRSYALERLKINGEMYFIKEIHSRLFFDFAAEAETKLTSAERGPGRWLDKLNLEYENFRAVLEWCLENADMCQLGLGLAGNLFWFWNLRGHLSEGRKWLEALLDQTTGSDSSVSRAKALYGAGGLAFLQSDYTMALSKLNESIEIWGKYEKDFNAEAKVKDDARRGLGYCKIIVGVILLNQGNYKDAKWVLKESLRLFEELLDEWGKALSLNDLGRVLTAEKDYEKAEVFYNQSYDIWEKFGDRWGLPLTLNCLGVLSYKKQEFTEAIDFLNRALDLQRPTDKWGKALNYKELGAAFYHLANSKSKGNYQNAKNDYIKSIQYFDLSLVKHQELGRRQLVAECLEGLANIAFSLKEPRESVILFGASMQLREAAKATLPELEYEEDLKTLKLLESTLGHQAYQKSWEKGYQSATESIVEQAHRDALRWIDELQQSY